jgi:hypothetical protein
LLWQCLFYPQAGVYHGKYLSPSWYLGRRIYFPCWHFFFLWEKQKNFVGSGVKIRVGRVTGNQQLFFLGLRSSSAVCCLLSFICCCCWVCVHVCMYLLYINIVKTNTCDVIAFFYSAGTSGCLRVEYWNWMMLGCRSRRS